MTFLGLRYAIWIVLTLNFVGMLLMGKPKEKENARHICRRELKMRMRRLFCVILGLVFVAIGCKKQPSETAQELSQAGNSETLRRAVRAGDIKQVQEFIAAGVDLSKKTWPDWTPLHDAAACGHRDIAELLIAKGAEIDARDEWDRTPLILALCDGYEDVAELLVDKGADVNAIDTYGRTPLLCAFHWTSESAVKFLIARGADVNVITRPHTYVFGIFALEHKPLHDAARLGYKNIVGLLIDKGADVNAKNGDGQTPMDVASGAGHQDIVELLRAAGGESGIKANADR